MKKQAQVRLITALLAALAGSTSLHAAQSAKPSPPPPVPCSGPELKQLDFWLGEWDLKWPATGQQPAGVGTNRITKILNGCVIQENFHGSGEPPLTGMSVSTFNPQLKKWQQTWVDDQGSYLDFTGQFENNEMTLSMERPGPAGKPVKLRMVFKNIRPDILDWSWEKSIDGGKTWQVQWPIHYVRKKA